MRNLMMIGSMAAVMLGEIIPVQGVIVCSGESAAIRVNSPVPTTVNKSLKKIYASPWQGIGESVLVSVDGSCIFSTTNQSETAWTWQPLTTGNHALSCTFGTNVLKKTLNVTALDFYVTPGPNPPMAKDNNVSITPTTRNFGVNGGGNAILVSGSSATWTAAKSASWITLNSTSGNVGYPVAYTVSANTNVEQRTGYVYVSGWVHTVTQDGVGGTISPENREFEHQGGSGTITVSAANKMVWQARPNVDWLSVTPTSGAGAGSVTYQVAPYNDVATRQGTLTVAGNTFTVFQYGRRMKLDSYSMTKDYETHVIPITVNALAITQWNVTPNNSWISVVDAGNGQGGDLVTIAIAENPSYKSRTGTVAIGTETFTVTQQGRPTAALSFSVNPTASTASVNGANGMIAVTATPDLPWTATSGANWITVYAATATGAGNGNVVYNASPNPTLSQRTGTVTITPEAASGLAAKTHTVTQPAAESALSLNGYEFEAAGESCSVEVSVANIVQWSVSESLNWITVNGTTSRVGPGTVVLQATANNTVYPRSGTVKIAGKNFSVSQKARGVELEYDTKLFGTDGGYESISIHPDGNVSWTAVASDATWITIFQGDSGTGDGEILYIVAPYVGEEGVRTGWITVGDKKVYITQRAYDLNISPNGSLMTGNNGAGEFSVSAGIGDVWTAIVTEPWITLVSGYDAGTGNGTVRFLYTENTTGKMRTGKIIVNGEVYTLQQRERTMVAITATAEHGGHVSGGGSYDLGSQVTLTAVPDSGYKFSYWTGSVSSMQNPLSVTVDVAKSYTAVFEPLPIAFTSVVSGTSGVSLTWNNLAWATMYRIYRGTMSVPSSATVLAELPNSGNCTYLDKSGDVNVEYWYWIEAEGPSDEVMSDPMTGRKERLIVNSSITYTNLRGATNPNPATYQEGTLVSFSNPGAVTGYTFAGWTPAQITADMTGAQTVRAAWTANRYSIAYDPNGGSGSMSPTSATYDSEATVAANGFTWSGHVFMGWATNATGEVIYVAGQPVTNLTAQSSGIVTLYAVWVAELDIDVPTGMETNITVKIGAEYGDLVKRGGGTLTLSAANEFSGTITNSGGGLIVADIGRGIPSSAGMVFLSGTYAPLSATSLTVPLGTGLGKFDMSLDHLKIAALHAPLTVNFGGSAEPIVSGGPMNPNAKAFHFGWKDDNGEYPITVLNPFVISSPLTLRSQRNSPVTLAGGVRAASGITGKSLDMPDGWQSQFRFTETGPLYIPKNKWNAQGGGTTTFDGGRHEVGEVYGSRHNIVFTNDAHFVSSVCYFGRDNEDNVVNIYAYDSVISNASGNVRLGCTSKAKGNWYMRGGELAFADVSGTPSFAIGDMGQGAFYQESGDVKLRNSAMYLGFNSAYS